MPKLVLGPVLRHVGTCDATVWVETDVPCRVEVTAGRRTGEADTFTVAGHHYAIVVIDGLDTGSSVPYRVTLDDEPVWPVASLFPPSRIRTIAPGKPLRFAFGSCRSPSTVVVRDPTGSGDDVLAVYARDLAATPEDGWPDALLMLGDQVYADETSPATRAFIRGRRDVRRPPREEVADFEEYTQLYREAWGETSIRWLLSTVPSSMIFDDHDVHDDWNTSAAWRRDMERTGWWQERITGALMSYWIYQHLGNLSPEGLAADSTYRRVLALPDATDALREFGRNADAEADGGPATMWSYRRDLGPVRLLVIDSRAGRVLVEGRRGMVSDAEFDWIERQVEGGGFDHLVIATSVPWLLPRALNDLESFDEALAAGVRGRRLAWLGERLRRAVDLEHWAAFRRSFDRLGRFIVTVGTGSSGHRAPDTITVLSGDVHHTYASEATFPAPMRARVHQLTCSPFHNSIPLPMRLVFTAAWSRWAERLSRRLAAFAKVPPVAFEWTTTAGPYFGNHVGLLDFDGRSASFSLVKAAVEDGETTTVAVPDSWRDLTPRPPEPAPVPVPATA